MKVYFSAARDLKHMSSTYRRIIDCLMSKGIQVCDDTKGGKKTYKEVVEEMDRADFLVFETSGSSSINVGCKVALSYWKNKPTIILHKEGREDEPIMFEGAKSGNFFWIRYFENNLEEKLLKAVEEIKKILNVRFNLFVPRSLMSYLDWAAKNIGVNKSEYLRMLIEKEIKRK